MNKKTLKFPSHFKESILARDKGATTRLFDEKNISVGDTIDFLDRDTGDRFATVKATKVYEKPFQEAMQDAHDIQGMYDQYESYHQRKIQPDTPMKFIYHEIIEKFSTPEGVQVEKLD
ncbi:hypothetical protein MYX07_03095 [Patescibacteria group bacterium AH-259-L07]|nr:hypothetical protein [Patescibacteria group bacterium AH-259-L07]